MSCVTKVTNIGGIEEFEILESGTDYQGGEMYIISGGSGEGARVRMTELSMSVCQRKCGLDDMCTAMAFDEDGNSTTCRLYQGKYAYTKVSPGGRQFKPNDFSDDAPGKCRDGKDNRFMAKDDIGRAIIQMPIGSEEKCKQRCQDMPGCNAVNMKVEDGALICRRWVSATSRMRAEIPQSGSLRTSLFVRVCPCPILGYRPSINDPATRGEAGKNAPAVVTGFDSTRRWFLVAKRGR